MSALVSIVIPCRNERRFIGPCLDSILANDYPKDSLEILVADGLSEDGTRAIVEGYAVRHSSVRLVDNPGRIVPTGLNLAIAAAKGLVIMRMDAHALYPSDYISTLTAWLEKSGADNVGCALVTLPGAGTAVARAIAIGLSHPFGIGNALFRLGTNEPREVDTVPFGCYRRDVFERVGLFDEELVRNQDDEFNFRLIRRGGRILLVPGLVIRYFARDTLSKLWRMYYQYGYNKPLVARKVGRVMTARQLAPSAFMLALAAALAVSPGLFLAVAGAYMLADAACSLGVARREGARGALVLFVVFPIIHLGYGLGFLAGLIGLAGRRRKVGRA